MGERGCVSEQREGVVFSKEEGGGVFVVAEGERVQPAMI